MSHGLDVETHAQASRRSLDNSIRPRCHGRTVLPISEPAFLFPHRRLQCAALFDRGMVLALLGWIRSNHRCLPRDLAGQQRRSQIWLSKLRYRRSFHQLLVGCPPDVWRRLAQQPSCLPPLSSSRAEVVGGRSLLDAPSRTGADRLGETLEAALRNPAQEVRGRPTRAYQSVTRNSSSSGCFSPSRRARCSGLKYRFSARRTGTRRPIKTGNKMPAGLLLMYQSAPKQAT